MNKNNKDKNICNEQNYSTCSIEVVSRQAHAHALEKKLKRS